MKFPNISGESVAKSHEGWIDLTGFTLSATAATGAGGAATGAGAGKARVSGQVTVTMDISKASVQMMSDLGTVVTPVTVDLVKATVAPKAVQTVFSYKFTDVAISSYELSDTDSASGGLGQSSAAGQLSGKSVEVVFAYRQVEVTYSGSGTGASFDSLGLSIAAKAS